VPGPAFCTDELGVAAWPPAPSNPFIVQAGIAMGLFFIVVCGVGAAVFVALAAAMGRRAARTRAWSRVDGRVLSNGITIQLLQGEAETGDIDAYDRRYRPNVSYEYAVDGAARVGTLIAPTRSGSTPGRGAWSNAIRSAAPSSSTTIRPIPRGPCWSPAPRATPSSRWRCWWYWPRCAWQSPC
jgi:hypothetical protein